MIMIMIIEYKLKYYGDMNVQVGWCVVKRKINSTLFLPCLVIPA